MNASKKRPGKSRGCSSRRTLPPLNGPPMESAPSPNDQYPLESVDPTSTTSSSLAPHGKDIQQCVKIETVDLLAHHLRFARGFRENDAAKLMPFLDKHVHMTTHKGEKMDGQAAVLAYLVSPKMEKLARQMRLKGQPSCTGPRRSMFTYDHGFLVRQPFLVEMIEWSSPGVALSITHTPVAQASSKKAWNEIVSEENPTEIGCRSRRSRSSISRGSQSSEEQQSVDQSSGSHCINNGYSAVVQSILVRSVSSKRKKFVNAFVTMQKQSSDGAQTWQSPTIKHTLAPKWSSVEIELSASDRVLDITLWDAGIFRDTIIATVQVEINELLHQSQVAGCSVVHLASTKGRSNPPIEVKLVYATDMVSEVPQCPDWEEQTAEEENGAVKSSLCSGDHVERNSDALIALKALARPLSGYDRLLSSRLLLECVIGMVLVMSLAWYLLPVFGVEVTL